MFRKLTVKVMINVRNRFRTNVTQGDINVTEFYRYLHYNRYKRYRS